MTLIDRLIDQITPKLGLKPAITQIRKVLVELNTLVSAPPTSSVLTLEYIVTHADILEIGGSEADHIIILSSGEVAADEYIEVLSCSFYFNYGGVAYDGGDLRINTNPFIGADNPLVVLDNVLLTKTASFAGIGRILSSDEGLTQGKPVLGAGLALQSSSFAIGGGHADTTTKITLTYKKIKI